MGNYRKLPLYEQIRKSLVKTVRFRGLTNFAFRGLRTDELASLVLDRGQRRESYCIADLECSLWR